MARTTSRLTALKVDRTTAPGMYADGGGLYLRVTKEGTKNWVLRYMLDGRPRWMGLGPVSLIGLQEARAKALDARRLRHEGVDPIEARKSARQQARLDAAKSMTFKECVALTSPRTRRVGTTQSTRRNGRRRSRPMPSPLSVRCQYRQ